MKQFTNALMLGAISIALVALSSCGGDREAPMAINGVAGDLHYADTVLLSTTGAPADAVVSYTTSNEYVAVISGDTLFANHVGEAVVTATAGDKTATLNVKVAAKYNLATEPLWAWGVTPDELKAKKTDEPAQESETSIFYLQNAEKKIYEAYIFKNNALIASALQIQDVSKETINEYLYFLMERYQYAGTSKDQTTLYFVDAMTLEDATKMLLVYTQQNSLIIEYQPYEQQSNAPAWKDAKRMPLF